MNKIKTAAEVFNLRAKEYQEKFMDVALYHESFDLFCSKILNQNANILEIACGPGNITKYLLKRRPDFKILGIDLASKMIELAKINNPDAEFKLLDCRNIGKIEKRYDAIMCGFCLPYLSKEEAIKLISDSSKLLNTNGVLYLSTMEDDYGKSGIVTSSYGDQTHMYYHQADYLTSILNENDFKIIDLNRKEYSTQDGTKTTDLLIIAGK